MQQDDPWSLDATSQPVRTEPKVEPQVPTSLEEALLALDQKSAPVFAVLDGAQFDNLPQELLLGDFVSRPLYLDRGENNPEQIITAPHMVWLDERPEKVAGRAPKDTIPALMALIAGRPAAVFWQCPDGAVALYRHLRRINLVYLPRAALAEADRLATANDFEPALLRHADANVVAQFMPSACLQDVARMFGPASAIVAAADHVWSCSHAYLMAPRPERLPRAIDGIWRISPETMEAIEHYREGCLRRKAVEDFSGKSVDVGTSKERRRQVLAAFDRALFYGLEEMKDIWDLISLDLKYGQVFEKRPEFAEALYELMNRNQAPASRIHYARLACENVKVW
ncbi:DUF4123 domain-containing protein [Paracoccus tegillarcae]|uniref:Uncharacterized protein n=1 Tax=Paracoccus tegillarcae TaxID=1529068 RepID=A0A2K9EWD5_9RHOB|nr:DUF4123 domain-containing protein [Paracoccus tegillarcae]AUH33594.1 hypothetical protein CUV01_09530 [Paracoccus tegillarcae]